MKSYVNEFGKTCFKGVDDKSLFSADLFHKVERQSEDDESFAFHSNLGSLTVLDRMTGFGWRDIETGFRDLDGNFWLASGNIDVRSSGCETVVEAIDWVKSRANTCVPDES